MVLFYVVAFFLFMVPHDVFAASPVSSPQSQLLLKNCMVTPALPDYYKPFLMSKLTENKRPPITYISSKMSDLSGDTINNQQCFPDTKIKFSEVTLRGCDCSGIQCNTGDACVCRKSLPICMNIKSQLCRAPESFSKYLSC